MKKEIFKLKNILICGGGRKNKFLIEMIKKNLNLNIIKINR